jgi:2-polyprenyl-6-methoxyphenol hydroxylase-like FAD-dependent oxidoreductase
MNVENVLVVGGGPGGLVAATALSRAGAAVDLVELEPELTARGVAVNIQNSPLRALAGLGLIDDIVDNGHTTATLHLLDAAGTPVAPPIQPPSLVPGYPASVELYRITLARILEAAALEAGARIHYGRTVTALQNRADGVEVTFSDGTSGAYDLVVGADGINSRVREMLFGPDAGAPSYSGQCIWRTEADRGDVAEFMSLAGPSGKLGLLPLTDERMYVFLVKNFPTMPARGELGDLDEALRAALSDYSGPASGLADRLHPGADFRGLYSFLLPKPWYRGRVVLIGDAVHATTPHLSYGLGLAVEDGVILTEMLEQAESVEDALEGFVERRYERCRLVVENSRSLSTWEQHPTDDPMAAARLMGQSIAVLTELP